MNGTTAWDVLVGKGDWRLAKGCDRNEAVEVIEVTMCLIFDGSSRFSGLVLLMRQSFC